jgi:hypothetical protein
MNIVFLKRPSQKFLPSSLFKGRRAFSLAPTKNSTFPSLGMKLDFNDFQKAKLLLSYKLTRLGREVNKVNPVF